MTPAFAGAPGPYVGIEGGVTFPQSTDLDVILNNVSAVPPTTTTRRHDARDPVALDSHVAVEPRVPRPVHHAAAFDHHVVRPRQGSGRPGPAAVGAGSGEEK